MKSRVILSIIFICASIFIVIEAWQYLSMEKDNSQQNQLRNTQVYLEGDEISALYPMDDSLWVGGKDGIKKIDYETGKVIDYVISDVQLIYAAQIIMSENDNSIWIGHNDGVTILLEDGNRIDFSEPDITGGRVNTILETARGIYVGTMQGCTVFTYHDGAWYVSRTYNKNSGLAADPVNVLAEINEDIWFGSYLDNEPGGISILSNDDTWNYLSVKEGLPHPYINAILPTNSFTLVGTGQLTAGGLAEIEKKNNTYIIKDTFDTNDGIPGEKIRQLYMDNANYIWITTESNGLIVCRDLQCIMHPINGIVLNEKDGLSDNEIKCIVETETHYWLGGRYGLTRISKDTINELMN